MFDLRNIKKTKMIFSLTNKNDISLAVSTTFGIPVLSISASLTNIFISLKHITDNKKHL